MDSSLILQKSLPLIVRRLSGVASVFILLFLYPIAARATGGPPSNISDLVVRQGGQVLLRWSAPGDDGTIGTASYYDIRYSTMATWPGWWDAQVWKSSRPVSGPCGTPEEEMVTGLIPHFGHMFRIRAFDDVNNWSESNIAGGQSGNFYRLTQELDGLTEGDVAWADFDNDGDLDFAVLGCDSGDTDHTRIYRNCGSSFVVHAELLGLLDGSIDWGDFDNDRNLDIVICGESAGTRKTKLYRNDNSSFVWVQDFHGISGGTVRWGDYNIDGFLDILECGYNGTNWVAKLWKNKADGTFVEDTEAAKNLVGVDAGDAAWADYNRDGLPDLIITGIMEGGTRITKLFWNNRGIMREDTSQAVIPMSESSVAWGDYNSDGWLDLAICGYSGVGPQTKIYRNVGGILQEEYNITGLGRGGLAWGDFDNDGLLDLLGSGMDDFPNRRLIVFRQNPSGGFYISDEPLGESKGMNLSSLGWADFDNDGDIDFVVFGATGLIPSGADAAIFVNTEADSELGNNPNYVGGPPGGGMSAFESGTLTLFWLVPGDMGEETDINGLYYAVRVSTVQGQWNKVSGEYGSPLLGNYLRPSVSTDTLGLHLRGIVENTTNWWQVATIDAELARTVWSSIFSIIPNQAPAAITSFWAEPGDYEGEILLSWVAPGDDKWDGKCDHYSIRFTTNPYYDWESNWSSAAVWKDNRPAQKWVGEQEIEMATGLMNGVTYYFRIKAADEVPNWSGLSSGATSWAQIDVILPGVISTLNASVGEQILLTWTAPGDNQYKGKADRYEIRYSSVTPFAWESASVWKENRPVGGSCGYIEKETITGLVPQTTYYFAVKTADEIPNWSGVSNLGKAMAGNFWAKQELVGMEYCSLAWGDYNNDGDLDLALAGMSGPGKVTRIYKNDAGLLSEAQNLEGVESASLAWGDYDRDGDLDLVVAGMSDSGRMCKLFQNNTSSFTEVQSFTGVDHCALTWGDYDNDGDLDLALAGYTGSERITKLYRNDSGILNEDTLQNLTGVEKCALTWGDYDNDGDLDLALAGYTGSERITKLYRNDSGTLNEDTSQNITGVGECSLAWADYNADGWLDLAIAGWSPTLGRVTEIYKNNSGSLSKSQNLTGVWLCSLAWGDYDNDGDLDLIVSGYDTDGKILTRVYRNDSGNLVEEQKLLGVEYCSVAWADYDKDGDLDLAIAGYSSSGSRVTKIYVNEQARIKLNSAPLPPASGFQSIFDSGVLTLTWEDGSDPDSTDPDHLYYAVRVSTVDVSSNVVSGCYSSPLLGNYLRPKVSSTTLGVELKGIIENMTYYWWVQAIDGGLRASGWSVLQQIVPNQEPAAVTNLTAAAGAKDGEVDLTWTAPGDDKWVGTAAWYQIKYATYAIDAGNWAGVPGAQWKAVSAPGGQMDAATITGLTPGTTYFFALKTQDEVPNISLLSNCPSTPAADLVPQPPTGLSAAAGDWKVTLSWTPNSEPDIMEYRIHRSTICSTTGYSVIGSTDLNNYTDSTVTPYTTYWYRLTACDWTGHESNYSSSVSTIPYSLIPLQPQNFAGTAISTTSIKWSWNDVPNESGYRIISDTGGIIIDNLGQDTTYWNETSLTVNTSYYRYVQAYNVNGSSNSLADTKYTRTSIPVISYVLPLSTATLKLEWSGNGSYYFVQFSTTADGPWQDLEGYWIAGSTSEQNGLSPNIERWYHVKAKNGDSIETQYSTSDGTYTFANPPVFDGYSEISTSSIRVNWFTNSNPPYTEYFVENTTKSTNSSWISTTTWVSDGLTSNTCYGFRICARNVDGTVTDWIYPPNKWTAPQTPTINSTSHTDGAKTNVSIVTFTATSPSYDHFHYRWDNSSAPAIAYVSSGTYWTGVSTNMVCGYDGHWYFHVVSHNPDHDPSPAIDTFHINYNGTPPEVNPSAVAQSSVTVDVTYNEAVKHVSSSETDDALNPVNYTINLSLNVSSVTWVSGNVFRLATSQQVSGSTYTITVSTNIVDEYGNNLNINASTAAFVGWGENALPQVTYNQIPGELTNGTGKVKINIETDDQNNDDCRLKVKYSTSGPGGPWEKATIETGTLTADFGNPDVDNAQDFQIGSSTPILTSGGSNTLVFYWLSASDLPDTETGVCYLNLTVNDFQASVSTVSASFTIDNKPPTPDPAEIGSTNVQSTVTITWTAVTGTDQYPPVEYRFASETGTGTWSSGNTYTRIDLASNTSYYARVQIRDSYGNQGGWSTKFTTWTLANIPRDFSHSTQTTTSITWSWSSGGSQKDFYAWCESPLDNSGYITETEWTQSNLSTNTWYGVNVKARNQVDRETGFVSTGAWTAIEIPEGVVWNDVNVTSITVQCAGELTNLTTGQSGVYFGGSDGASGKDSNWLQANEYTATGLGENTLCTFRVRARNGGGDTTDFSNTSSTYTLLFAPEDANISFVVSSSTALEISVSSPTNPTTGLTGCKFFELSGNIGGNDSNILTGSYTYTDTGLVENSSYTYKVKYRNASGVWTDTNPSGITKWTLCDQPTGVSAVADSTGSISLSIDLFPNDNVASSGYNWTCIQNPGNGNGSSSRTYTDDGLNANKQYGYSVNYINGDGTQTTTVSTYVYTRAQVPTQTTPNNIGTSSVTVHWSATPNPSETKYLVQCSTSDGFENILDSSGWGTWGTEYSFTSLSANTTMYFRIMAKNGDEIETNWSNKIGTCTHANHPVDPGYASRTTNQITWSWESGGAQESFYAWFGSTNTGWTTDTSWLLQNLNENTSYYLSVKARNYAGVETVSVSTVVWTTVSTPAAPSWVNVNISSITTEASSIPNIGAGLSAIYFDCVQGEGGNDSDWVTITTYTDTGLGENTLYEIRVKARNGDGEETSYSSITSTYTLLSAPSDSDISIAVSSSSYLTISVTPPPNQNSGLTGCKFVEVSGNPGGSGSDVLVGSYSYVDSGLIENSSYTYQARYRNGSGIWTALNPGTTTRYTWCSPPTGFVVEPKEIGGEPPALKLTVSTFTNDTVGLSRYYFDCVGGGGDDSGWQASSIYWDFGLQPNTLYSYKVYYRNAEGINSGAYQLVNKYTYANKPGKPTVKDPTSTSLTVVIDQNGNPGNTTYAIYNVESAKYVQGTGLLGDTTDWRTYAEWGGANGIVNTGLTPSTTYTYQVKARNGDLVETLLSDISDSACTNPEDTPPAAITNLAAQSGSGNGEVLLSWTAPGDDGWSGQASLYIVKYASYALTEANWLASGTTLFKEYTVSKTGGQSDSLTVTGLTLGATYWFAIKTQDEIPNTSDISNSTFAVAMLIIDNDPPTLVSRQPAANSFGVRVNPTIKLVFSEQMDSDSVKQSFSITAVRNNLGHEINTPVNGELSVSQDNTEYTLTPHLEHNRQYRVSISTVAKDDPPGCNPLTVSQVWEFVTIFDPDESNVTLVQDKETGKELCEVYLAHGALKEPGYVRISTSPVNDPLEVDSDSLSLAIARRTKFTDPCHFVLPASVREANAYKSGGTRITDRFGASVSITIPYEDEDDNGIIDNVSPAVRETALAIYYFNEEYGNWVLVPGSVVDTSANTVSAAIPHFSVYAIMGASEYDLSNAYAYPVPFDPNTNPEHREITFTNLSTQCRIRIYTLAGELVADIEHDETAGSEVGVEPWDVANSGNQPVASDVYLYYIRNEKKHKSGKLVIIR